MAKSFLHFDLLVTNNFFLSDRLYLVLKINLAAKPNIYRQPGNFHGFGTPLAIYSYVGGLTFL